MIRFTRIGISLVAVVGLLVLTAGAALAETSLSVAAPAQAVVGDVVPVIVTVTEDGAPVADLVVVLNRTAEFAGVFGEVEIVRATTGEDGKADLSFVQRAAEQTAELTVEVVDGDVEPLAFSVTSVGEAEQIFESEVGVNLPGLGGWVLIVLVGGLWLIILSTVLRLRSVAAGETDPSDEVRPKRRKLPYVISGGVALIMVVLVTVLVRNPATHANLDGPSDSDRVPHSHIGELTPLKSPGLAPEFAAPTGDVLVDGARAFFGWGCASCHGLDAESGVVGGDISGEVNDGFDEFLSEVRKGPDGMPKYPVDAFSEEDLAVLHAYLESLFSG